MNKVNQLKEIFKFKKKIMKKDNQSKINDAVHLELYQMLRIVNAIKINQFK